MKKSVSTFALTLFIVIALVLVITPTSVQAATQIYFTNFMMWFFYCNCL